jgi:hypothetical protein
MRETDNCQPQDKRGRIAAGKLKTRRCGAEIREISAEWGVDSRQLSKLSSPVTDIERVSGLGVMFGKFF